MSPDKDKSAEDSKDENALDAPPESTNALDGLGAESGTPQEGNPQAPDGPHNNNANKSRFRRIWAAVNVYLLIFILLLVVAGIVFVVSYLNSQKEPLLPKAALQDLTQEDLSKIASGDASVGDPRYILNIQSDAVFAGNALVRGDLNVAGNIKLGKALSVPNLTVSGSSNLGTTQASTLAVAGDFTAQGKANLRSDVDIQGNTNINGKLDIGSDLNVGRSLTIGGNFTAASITTGSLNLAGNGSLNISNHINATGPTPSRSTGGAIGGGGSTSISGSDMSGTVNINAGTSPGTGCYINVSFRQAYSGTPQVMLTPITSDASKSNYYVTRSSGGFSVCFGSSPGSGKRLSFDYFVVN